MKKLVIVSTRPDGGIGGGIPSALIGYMNGLDIEGIPYQVVESHVEGKPIFVSWLFAFWQILKLSIKYKKQVVFWYHCGPWLSLTRKFSLALIPRLFNCKTVAHIHSPTFNDYLTGNLLLRLLTKVFLRPYHELIVLSGWWKNLLVSSGVSKKIIISPNPNSQYVCDIAQNNITTNNNVKGNEGSIQIVTMARLIEGKGVALVIEALSQLPEKFELTIAGDGPLKPYLEKITKELALCERITFTGWVDGSRKEELLTNADVFCLPSSYDSFGMVFIEAMAFNLPIVAYSWGPIKDVVTEDVGMCCSELSDKNVSDTIFKLSQELDKYQRNGVKRVLENYTPSVVVENIVLLLD